MPEAHKWYGLAGNTPLGDEQLAWKARAALRAADWQAVRDAIDRMSVSGRPGSRPGLTGTAARWVRRA